MFRLPSYLYFFFALLASFFANTLGAQVSVGLSDERSKIFVSDVSSDSALAVLQQIEIKRFHYIDAQAQGAQQHVGVIAQQIKRVLPEAVVERVGYVPDIFRSAEGWTHEGDKVQVRLSGHGIKAGERIRFILDGHTRNADILEAHNNIFSVPADLFKNMEGTENLFIYGREISDMLYVSYRPIFVTNAAATPALATHIKQVADDIESALKDTDKATAELDEIKERVQKLQ